LVFARYGVVWALETFKSQKRWERDAATFAGILAALREMDRANEILYDGEIGAKLYSDEYLDEASSRWASARKKFDDAAAGAIFLPVEVSSIILELEKDIANVRRYNTYGEYLDHRGHYVSEALRKLERTKHLL
jgi:hypothetical protein